MRVSDWGGALGLLALTATCGRVSNPSEPQDLLESAHIVFAPTTEEELDSPVRLGDEVRPALVAPTPAEFRYRVQLPERALLSFALGITEAPGAPGAGGGEMLPGNRMAFSVRAGEDVIDDVVFERQIHVARRGEWIEQVVDLSQYAGREIWLSFRTDFPGGGANEALPLVGVFGEPTLHDRARFGRGRAVVVVSIDTARRDHLSLYGYPRRTTPGLEAFAKEAIVFDDAVSTSSWTLPAHASLLTSTYPSVHGAVNLEVGLSADWPSLPKRLQSAGFFTQAIVTHVYLSREYGFGEGFDRHQYLPETRAEEVTNRAIRFLRTKGDRDFFLFLHYYDPHWHYDPPPPYDRMFDPTYEGAASGVWWDFKDFDEETIDPRDLHHIEALYDGELLYTDRHLERLFREMKRLDVFDKSLIVITSDHGEEFLEHGRWEHQKTLYEEQLRIPLLLKLPFGEGGGRRVPHQVSLVDVAPTVLAKIGLPVPGSFQGGNLLAGESSELAWAETEHTVDGSRKLAVRRGERGVKTIFTLAGDSLAVETYDLSSDAAERHSRSELAERSSETDRLEEYLAMTASKREGVSVSPPVELDEAEVERLRALGYIEPP